MKLSEMTQKKRNLQVDCYNEADKLKIKLLKLLQIMLQEEGEPYLIEENTGILDSLADNLETYVSIVRTYRNNYTGSNNKDN